MEYLDILQPTDQSSADVTHPFSDGPDVYGEASPRFYLAAASNTTPSGTSAEATSPNFGWKPDEFALNQHYQSYREELRDLIFNAAQSVAPTREGSPVAAVIDASILGINAESDSQHQQSRRTTAQILSSGKMSVYLGNYISSIAPWVSCQYAPA
jgi:hypothetical protein